MKGWKENDKVYCVPYPLFKDNPTLKEHFHTTYGASISAGDFIGDPDGLIEFDREEGSYEDCEWGTRNYSIARKPK